MQMKKKPSDKNKKPKKNKMKCLPTKKKLKINYMRYKLNIKDFQTLIMKGKRPEDTNRKWMKLKSIIYWPPRNKN